jgi:hypothetical protein
MGHPAKPIAFLLHWWDDGDSMPNDNDRLNDLIDGDSDVSHGVSSNMYDRTFDELITEVSNIPDEERTLINWYAMEPHYTTTLIRYLSRNLEVSFNGIAQVALSHGFSIFKHQYSQTMSLIDGLDDAAVEMVNEKYLRHSNYRIMTPKDNKKMIVRTDHETSETMGQVAAAIGCSRTYLAGICIFMSLNTSMTVPDKYKDIFGKHLSDFDGFIKIKESINTQLS